MGESRKELRPRLGSVSMKDSPQIIVVNELLAFAFDELKRSPLSDTKCAIIKFYSANSISAAKKMLWESFSSALPTLNSHRDTAKRSAADADLDDILEAVAHIDSQREGSKDLHTIFVARNLRNLPPLPSLLPPPHVQDDQTTNSIAQIMTRLESIEYHMGQLGGLVGDALPRQTRVPWFGRPEEDVSSDCDVQVTSVKQRTQCRNTPQQEELQVESPTRQATYSQKASANADLNILAPSASGAGRSASGAKVDEDGYTLVESNRRRGQRGANAGVSRNGFKKSQPIVGSRRHETLKAGPRRSDVFIYRIGKDVTKDDISEFLEAEGVTPIVLERTSKDNAPAKSFHALLECLDVDKVKSAEFWPEGWCCRPWYSKRSHGDDNK